jgi:hypothetical protein
VLDHIEAGRFAEQPAGEHAAVLFGAALADIDLHEGAGFLRQLPRRGALAGRQADDHRADRARLAGLQQNVFGDIVALVEQPDRRHPLRHRGRALRIDLARHGSRRSGGAGIVERDALGLGFAGAIAGGKAQGAQRERGKAGEPHGAPYASGLPGVQAS